MSGITAKWRQVIRRLFLTGLDALMAGLAMLAAVRWRYDYLNKPIEVNIDDKAALVAAASTLLVWVAMRQDKAIWRFTSLSDFRRLLLGVVSVSLLVPLLLFLFFDRGIHYPRSAPFTGGALFFALIIISRLITMIVQNGDIRALFRAPAKTGQKALLVGPAPDLYNYLRDRSRRSAGIGFNPVGLIETSGGYQGRTIRSVPVLGGIEDLVNIYPKITSRTEEALQLISVNSSPDRQQTAKLVKAASKIGAPLARNTTEMGGKISPFEAADLIGREMRSLDLAPVERLIKGRRVLITGAGGSIGSELSEQIAALSPKRLSLVDQNEFNLFQLEYAIRPYIPDGRGKVWQSFLADVTDAARMNEIFEAERPDIVLHAAAMKHVPLGEENPLETLRTNVVGTKTILDACQAHGTGHFILISTDKAVRPANIMGASKRIVEMLTLSFQSLAPDMQAAAVRFGNVLASRGSVVNLFEEQIMAGGPVTVTHPEVNRYFMMVEEAAALVLQAAAIGSRKPKNKKTGRANIFVLEMGEPVNIRSLARQLIRLRGKIPDTDIKIEYTGLRPGEKLSEVLSYANEKLSATPIKGILKLDSRIEDPASILRRVDKLISAINKRDHCAVTDAMKALLPDYDPNGSLANGKASSLNGKSKAKTTKTKKPKPPGKTASGLATPPKP